MDILIALLLVGAAVALGRVSLPIQRKPPAPDPRIMLLAQYEAGLMAIIRERYQCTDEMAREVRRRFEAWEMDVADSGVQMGEDGKLSLSNETVDCIDRCALKIGVRPAPKREGAVKDPAWPPFS